MKQNNIFTSERKLEYRELSRFYSFKAHLSEFNHGVIYFRRQILNDKLCLCPGRNSDQLSWPPSISWPVLLPIIE